MKRALVIIGPTATGKTDLAIQLAKKFNGELIACDSRQVYIGLDIGTGKLPGGDAVVEKRQGGWGIQGVNIWLYDLVEPSKQFNAYDWAKKAAEVINEIESRGKLPIIVGGTGLYLQALLEGLDLLPSVDLDLRTELETFSLKDLQSRVAALSPARWVKLNHSDQNNPRRLIRVLEQINMYGYIDQNKMSNVQSQMSNVLKIGLTAPRPYLNSKINQRVLVWFTQGILQEVKNLIDRGVPAARFKEFGLEYALIVQYLKGEIESKERLTDLIQTKIRQYAKRQMTWFKRDKEITWFDISDSNLSHRVESEVENWYNELENSEQK